MRICRKGVCYEYFFVAILLMVLHSQLCDCSGLKATRSKTKSKKHVHPVSKAAALAQQQRHKKKYEKRFRIISTSLRGDMPNVEPLGFAYFTSLCRQKPHKLLAEPDSAGSYVKRCIENASSCETAATTRKTFGESEHDGTVTSRGNNTTAQVQGRTPSSSALSWLKDVVDSGRRMLMRRVDPLRRPKRAPAWTKDHPSKSDLAYIAEFARNVSYAENISLLPTKTCSADFGKLTNSTFSKGSWGSCALVGLGDTLLLSEYGPDIDNHDVVIRMGHLPLPRNLWKHTGNRTDIVFDRTGARKRDTHRPSHVAAYLCSQAGEKSYPNIPSFSRVKGAANLFCSKCTLQRVRTFLLSVYDKISTPGRKKTSGIFYAILLMTSQVCARLDFYGFSSNGGGTYYAPAERTKDKHNVELENWLLHHFMKNYEDAFRTCVYT
ncbi:glycosyltransferase family 29 protein [Pseudoscourfieldia marina]